MYLTSNASLYIGYVSLLLVSLVMVLFPLASTKKLPDILLVTMSILLSLISGDCAFVQCCNVYSIKLVQCFNYH